MTTSKETGGPAFPTTQYDHGGETDGMTLRDYFAAKAMQAFLSNPKTPLDLLIGKSAYVVADEMLEARNV